MKITHNTIAETLIIPLYGRSLGIAFFPQLYQDPYTKVMIKSLDYDLTALEKKKHTFFYRFGALEGILRSCDVLEEMDAYIKAHPRAAIVNLGCGLDVTPLIKEDQEITIYNVDVPEVIALRHALLADAHEHNIAGDLKDLSWAKAIDASHGVFLFAAGVFVYWHEEEVYNFIIALKTLFPAGVLVFDTLGKLGMKVLMKKTLHNMGIEDVEGLFYLEHFPKSWSVKYYLTGYVPLKEKGIPLSLRMMAYLFDHLFKMRICKCDL